MIKLGVSPAGQLLAQCVRHVRGGVRNDERPSVWWTYGNELVAEGWFVDGVSDVVIYSTRWQKVNSTEFHGSEAQQLRTIGFMQREPAVAPLPFG